MRVVGAPRYFHQHVVPRHPHDLAEHNCITLRLPTHGGLMPWDFGQDGNELSVRVSGQWIFNSMGMTRAALAGSGLGLAAGRPGAADAGRWTPAVGAGRLVPAFRWLLRVLPVAPPCLHGDAHGA